MHELANMAANKVKEKNAQHEPSTNLNVKVIFFLLFVYNMLRYIEMLKST